MKRIKNITFLIMFIYFIFPTFVNAATSLDTENQRPIVGNSIEIAVDIDYGKQALIGEAHYYVDYDSTHLQLEQVIWTQSKGTHSVLNNRIALDKTTATAAWEYGSPIVLKFKTLKEGVSKLSISEKAPGKFKDGSIVGQTYSGITINAVPPSTATKIGTLNVEGFKLSPTFNANKYDYTLTVPPTTTKVNITATKGEKNQTITGTGTRELNYGLNNVRVVVTAQNGNSSTYTIKITRTDDRTKDLTLKTLNVSNTEIKYDKNKTEYSATVSRSVENVMIVAQANNPRAQVVGTGTRNLVIGENVFYIEVTGADGKRNVYTIKITRSEQEIKENVPSTYLDNITLNGTNIKMKENTFVYLTSIRKDVENLQLTVVPSSTTAKYKITKPKLKTGFNKITIVVTEGDLPPTEYTIIVYKQSKKTANYETLEELNLLELINEDVYYETKSPNKIDSNIMSFLKTNNKELYYNVIDSERKILYQVVIPPTETSVNPQITFDENNPNVFQTELPSGVSVMLYVGDNYMDGTELKLSAYDDNGGYTDITTSVKVSNGYVNFTTNGQKNYVLSYVPISTTNTFDLMKILPIIIFGGAIAFLLIYILKKKSKSKNNKKSNEPLY